MIKSLLAVIVCLTLGSFSFSQDTIPRLENLSFASGYSANRSKVLIETENHIRLKAYDKILLLLESTSLTDQFVGSIICTRLAKDYKMMLSKKQIEKIKSIETSEGIILFNAGCTCHVSISLKDYFSGENPCGFRTNMENWISDLNKKYYTHKLQIEKHIQT